MGAIYRPSSWLRFGVVAKDINQPTFDAPGGGELKLGPQVRGGVAVNPYSSLTLTADVDATSNKTFVPGVKSQVLSLEPNRPSSPNFSRSASAPSRI